MWPDGEEVPRVLFRKGGEGRREGREGWKGVERGGL